MLFLFRKKVDAKPEYVEVAYIKEQPIEFQCGHYWSGISLCGPNFCGVSEWPKYEDIETILTKASLPHTSVIISPRNDRWDTSTM